MNDIDKLIPHREPFQFIDEIISANEDEIIGIKTYNDSFFLNGHFPAHNMVPGVILVESMAQCGGAGTNKLRGTSDGLWGVATIESAQFIGIVEFEKKVKMVVKNLKVSGRIIKQSGTAYCDEKIVAKATWVCAKL